MKGFQKIHYRSAFPLLILTLLSCVLAKPIETDVCGTLVDGRPAKLQLARNPPSHPQHLNTTTNTIEAWFREIKSHTTSIKDELIEREICVLDDLRDLEEPVISGIGVNQSQYKSVACVLFQYHQELTEVAGILNLSAAIVDGQLARKLKQLANGTIKARSSVEYGIENQGHSIHRTSDAMESNYTGQECIEGGCWKTDWDNLFCTIMIDIEKLMTTDLHAEYKKIVV